LLTSAPRVGTAQTLGHPSRSILRPCDGRKVQLAGQVDATHRKVFRHCESGNNGCILGAVFEVKKRISAGDTLTGIGSNLWGSPLLSMPRTMNALFPTESITSRASVWVRNPVWDLAWMLNALWLVPLALWLTRGYPDPQSSPLDLLYFGLTALFWIGHRLCSTWLAYCTEAYRPVILSEPVRFVLIPLLVAAACFAIFLPSDTAFPWSREQRVVGMAILDYACVTYHFAAQHFGALSLYRVRAKRATCTYTRRLDRIFALAVGGGLVFLSDILAGAAAYQDLWIHWWHIPAWLVSDQEAIRDGATLLLFLLTVMMLANELRTPRRSLPRLLYILGLSAMVAVALQPRCLFVFLVIWTSQHWILAMGIASQTPVGEPVPANGSVRRAFHALNARPWAILLVLVLSSILLLPFFEVEANWQGGTYYGDRIFGAIAAGLRTSSWVPALVAIGFAMGFVHYLLDRGVYRISDPRIRSAARGLLDCHKK